MSARPTVCGVIMIASMMAGARVRADEPPAEGAPPAEVAPTPAAPPEAPTTTEENGEIPAAPAPSSKPSAPMLAPPEGTPAGPAPTESQTPSSVKVGGAIGGAIGATVGLVVTAGVGIAAVMVLPLIPSLAASAGFLPSPVLLVLAGTATGGGAALGAWLGGADWLGTLLAGIGADIAALGGLFAGAIAGMLIGAVVGMVLVSVGAYAGFVVGAFAGMAVGTFTGAAAVGALGGFLDLHNLGILLGARGAADVE